MFQGSYVAIVTPFKNDKVDYEKLRELIEFQIENGTAGIVPCGTTGESATLNYDEHEEVIAQTVKFVKKRVQVIAGTGANCTDEAIMLTKAAEKAGCDAVLQVSPYYNKPTQKGLYLHFRKIAESVKLPVMLYNIQSRTAVNIETPTLVKLAKDCRNILAVKEASGSLDQMSQVIQQCPGLDVLSGDDALTLPVLSIGGKGVVSVVANIAPRDTADLVAAFQKGDIKKAEKLHYKLLPLVKAMFIETNPIPVKTAMGLMKLCSDEMRLPMCEMEEANKKKLEKELKAYGLIQ